MPDSHISQREARRLRKRVAALEAAENARRNLWVQEWPRGVEIVRAQFASDGQVTTAIRTARALRHAVVALADAEGMVRFMALPLASGKSDA